ncbi:AAA family ATPase [uncultured Pseudoteredinibacter sp.]|uniref:AAA family ATPase n=1 Tax=uncultured Pseudoteredinibacter sp. TaxID=1641701 RepID=UPI00261B7A2F|nr:AAA family ATPase [uncultured Pseudoteredinibacter sp.]
MKVGHINGIIPYTEKEVDINLNGKNLIITGKNGCGKTQLLQSIFNVLQQSSNYADNHERTISNLKSAISRNLKYIKSLKAKLNGQKKSEDNLKKAIELRHNYKSGPSLDVMKDQLSEIRKTITSLEDAIQTSRISTKEAKDHAKDRLLTYRSYQEDNGSDVIKETVISYNDIKSPPNINIFFNALRELSVESVESIQSLEKEKANISFQVRKGKSNKGNGNAGSLLERFLANWEVKSALSERKNNYSVTKELDTWKKKLISNLKILLDDESTDLIFDENSLNYQISQSGKSNFSFRNLSTGYSSVLKVFTDLLMTTEVSSHTPETINGFVIIDEIDAHLHPSLQRKILPFLSNLFPNIQFIVSTHSPFVISSENDTVVYDLSSRKLIDADLRAYSNEIILHSIFDVSDHSLYLDEILNNLSNEKYIRENISKIRGLIENSTLLNDESYVQLSSAYRSAKKKIGKIED